MGLDALVGQDDAVGHLTRLLAQDRLPHAMLFVGPASTGKMSAARALAKSLFCQTPDMPPGTSCGTCPACQKLEQGNHGDIHTVTTDKKTIPVAAIREATQQLSLRSVEGGAKFLIIEGAERMNASAQNALLKTLEEPPGRSHIIVITSRLRAILPTVVSRCQRVPFVPLPTAALAQVVAERRDLAPERAQLLAALAQGSLGVALELDLDTLLERRDRMAEVDAKLEGRTGPSALAALEAASDLSSDRAELIANLDLLLVWLHDQMVLAAGASDDRLANADRRDDLAQLTDRRGLRTVLDRAEDVMEAKRQIEGPFNWNAQMITEQLCLSLAGHARLVRLPLS